MTINVFHGMKLTDAVKKLSAICLAPITSWFQLFLVKWLMCVFSIDYIGILLSAINTTRDAIKLGNFTDWLSTYTTITYIKIIKIKALLSFQNFIIQFRHFCRMVHIALWYWFNICSWIIVSHIASIQWLIGKHCAYVFACRLY